MAVLLGPQAVSACAALGPQLGSYWAAVCAEGLGSVAANVRGEPGVVESDGHVFPLNVLDPGRDLAWTASFRSQYLGYGSQELHRLTPTARRLARAGLAVMGGLADAVRVDGVVQWSDMVLSTNLHDPALPRHINTVTEQLTQSFPRHPVVIRNLDRVGSPEVMLAAVDAGYLLVPSRVVYYFDGRSGDFFRSSTLRRDRKRFDAGPDYRVECPATELDAGRVLDLYEAIYLRKHRGWNTNYRERFVRGVLKESWLAPLAVRDSAGALLAVALLDRRDHRATVPFVGHDLSRPADDALYRRLVVAILEQVARDWLLLNYSSGADDFKRRRGGQPVQEYTAVFVRHLPALRRAAIQAWFALIDSTAWPHLRGMVEGPRRAS